MKNKQQFIKQFISYLFVGGGATIVEWVGFWLFDHCLHIQYLIATAFAFFFSTFANWLFGRLFDGHRFPFLAITLSGVPSVDL